MSKCRICKRTLSNPTWVRLGIGPVCARKNGVTGASRPGQTEADDDDLVPYDGGDLFIERISPWISEAGVKDFASGCRSNVPRQIYRHSPTGYNFGYSGSGPSDFALNASLLLCEHADDAYRIYQDFKFFFVSGATEDALVIQIDQAKKFFTDRGIPVK